MKQLHLEMIRVTEAAAISASAHVGRGDKIAADHDAVLAMRKRLNNIHFAGEIVIGEGKKDDAPGLFTGEKVGDAWTNWGSSSQTSGIIYDIAVDPLDGTTQTAKGGPEAMSVMAVGEKNSLLRSEGWYMRKLAVGPQIRSRCKVNVNDKIEHTIKRIASALNKDISRVTACLLDRPRHQYLIGRLRELGCRIKLIQDCDVSAAIATAIPDSGIDVYLGVGGAPEGVIGAAALKCLKGDFQGIMCDKEGREEDEKVYQMEDLARGDVIFCATGVTDGSLLKGVRWTAGGPITHSLLMRSESGTVRWMTAQHGN